jgi:hypothetical protein
MGPSGLANFGGSFLCRLAKQTGYCEVPGTDINPLRMLPTGTSEWVHLEEQRQLQPLLLSSP